MHASLCDTSMLLSQYDRRNCGPHRVEQDKSGVDEARRYLQRSSPIDTLDAKHAEDVRGFARRRSVHGEAAPNSEACKTHRCERRLTASSVALPFCVTSADSQKHTPTCALLSGAIPPCRISKARREIERGAEKPGAKLCMPLKPEL